MNNYTGISGKAYQKAVHHSSDFVYDLVAGLRAKKIKNYLTQYDIVLEYGIGNGWNISQLEVKEKHGYDVFYEEQNFTNSKIILYEHKEMIPHDFFDKIICHHVLEHLTDPFNTLVSFLNYLKPRGELILFVPFEKGRRFSQYNRTDKNMHLFSWNMQSFCTLVEKAGYSVEEYAVLKKGYDRFAGKLIERMHIPRYFYHLVVKLLRFIRPEYELLVRCKIARQLPAKN